MGVMYLPSEPISCHITQPGHFLMGLEEVETCSIGIRSD